MKFSHVFLKSFLKTWFKSQSLWCYKLGNCRKIRIYVVYSQTMMFKKVVYGALIPLCFFLSLLLECNTHGTPSDMIIVNIRKLARWWNLNYSSSKIFTYNDDLIRSSIYNNVMHQNMKVIMELSDWVHNCSFFSF